MREKVIQHKFPGRGQRSTPAATIDNVVYILSRLPGEVGQKLAALGASTTTGLIGGDLRLAEATLDARVEQERMAAEDPTNPLRLFGEKAEAEGGADKELRQRLEWRKLRDEQKCTNRELTDAQRDIGGGGIHYSKVQNLLNVGAMGFKEANTTEFKKNHNISKSHPLPDFMTSEQLAARKLMELVNKRKFESCTSGDQAVNEATNTNKAFMPVFAEQGIHNGPENPFKKVNRKLKLMSEKSATHERRLCALESAPPPSTTTVHNVHHHNNTIKNYFGKKG